MGVCLSHAPLPPPLNPPHPTGYVSEMRTQLVDIRFTSCQYLTMQIRQLSVRVITSVSPLIGVVNCPCSETKTYSKTLQ